MTSPPASGRLQNAIKYCSKVFKTGATGIEAFNSVTNWRKITSSDTLNEVYWMSADILMLNGASFCLTPPIGGLLVDRIKCKVAQWRADDRYHRTNEAEQPNCRPTMCLNVDQLESRELFLVAASKSSIRKKSGDIIILPGSFSQPKIVNMNFKYQIIFCEVQLLNATEKNKTFAL